MLEFCLFDVLKYDLGKNNLFEHALNFIVAYLHLAGNLSVKFTVTYCGYNVQDMPSHHGRISPEDVLSSPDLNQEHTFFTIAERDLSLFFY